MDKSLDEHTPQSKTVPIQVSPAPIWVRFLAGVADSIVAGLLVAVMFKFIVPFLYPEVSAYIYRFEMIAEGSFSAFLEEAKQLMESPDFRNIRIVTDIILFSVFFFYFFINERAFGGGSLGKMIFRIIAVRKNSDKSLPIRVSVLRSWLKTVFLLVAPLLWVTFFWAIFNKEKRTVHDLLTGTWVID